MNSDIEEALNGPEAGLRPLVESLRAAPQARVGDGFSVGVMAGIAAAEAMRRRRFALAVVLPLAACFAALLAAHPVFTGTAPGFSMENLVACQRTDGSFSRSTAAPYVQAFAVTVLARDPSANRTVLEQAVDVLVRTQNAEGGWGADARLSARNVAALAAASDAGVKAAVPAHRRGLRYLRNHGIGEMSVAEMARDAREAEPRLTGGDSGIACSIALAARL